MPDVKVVASEDGPLKLQRMEETRHGPKTREYLFQRVNGVPMVKFPRLRDGGRTPLRAAPLPE